MNDWVRLIRAKQWTKNILVFAALLFTKSYLDGAQVGRSLQAFVAMCLISSAVYVLNDLQDVERDRKHPRKKDRPIASGRISVKTAWVLCVVLAVAAIGLAIPLGTGCIGIVLAYLMLQILYNAGIKHQPVADVFAVSMGFILRAMLGAAAIDVRVSAWLLFCTGTLALLVGFAKRRSEYISQGDERKNSRESLGMYTERSLDAFVMLSAGAAAMSYGIYAIDSKTATQYPALFLTCPFVFYGIFRYVFLTFSRDEGGEPETLLFADPHMLLSIVLFTISAVLAMSGRQIPFVEGR